MTAIEAAAPKHPRASRVHSHACPPGFVTEAELARRIGAHKRTLEAWRLRAYCPVYVKIGFSIFYKESAIADWLSSMEIDPAKSRTGAAGAPSNGEA
jgi:hypothetical protein